MNLFYAPQTAFHLPDIILDDQEARHVTKVLRLREGDPVQITDGRGNLYQCEITAVSKRDVTATVKQTTSENPPDYERTLFLGIIRKRDRLEFAVEKCVELGINRIVLFRGDHSEKQNVRADRVEAAALSAMKQSLRTFLPDTVVTDSLKSAIAHYGKGAALVMADETREKDGEAEIDADQNVVLIVGPEGGFSENERGLLKERGAVTYSMGPKRLRSETAAIAITDRFNRSG